MQQTQILRIVVASPGDVQTERNALTAVVSDQPAVLVVDQFEEVFTLCADD